MPLLRDSVAVVLCCVAKWRAPGPYALCPMPPSIVAMIALGGAVSNELPSALSLRAGEADAERAAMHRVCRCTFAAFAACPRVAASCAFAPVLWRGPLRHRNLGKQNESPRERYGALPYFESMLSCNQTRRLGKKGPEPRGKPVLHCGQPPRRVSRQVTMLANKLAHECCTPLMNSFPRNEIS